SEAKYGLFRLAKLRHRHDALTVRRLLDATNQGADHLRDRYEPELTRALPRGRHGLHEPVERNERVWPPVSRTEHVPRTHERRCSPRRVRSELAHQRFAAHPGIHI